MLFFVWVLWIRRRVFLPDSCQSCLCFPPPLLTAPWKGTDGREDKDGTYYVVSYIREFRNDGYAKERPTSWLRDREWNGVAFCRSNTKFHVRNRGCARAALS